MKQKADLSALNDEQRAGFAKVNALLGLAPDEVTFSAADFHTPGSVPFSTAAGSAGQQQPGGLVLSSDASESHVPPHYIPVGSVAEMRRIASNGETRPYVARPEDEAQYPAPLTAEDRALVAGQLTSMKPDVSPELLARIEQAAGAFVMLNPERVREYEPLINAMLFPGQIAAFVSADLNVPAGTIYQITGPSTVPVLVNFGTVTVNPGGCIQITVDCGFTSQKFTQL